MKIRPLVSIIILNWNGKELTRDCLKSIERNTDYPNYELIVVDQGSKDGSVEMIEDGFPHVKLIRNKKNAGFSAGNNQGFKLSRGKYVYVLNNDTEVLKGWLVNIVKVMENDERIAAAGSLQISPDKLGDAESIMENKIEEVETAGGAAMILRKKAIDKIGMFDDKHFSPIYGEENDWCYRARNRGYRIVLVKNSGIIHIGEATNVKEYDKPYAFVLRETNRIKAMLFNLPAGRLIKFVPGLSLIFVKSILHGQGHLIMKSYYTIWKDRKEILKERKLRLSILKK